MVIPEANNRVPPVLLKMAPPRPPGVAPMARFPERLVAASTLSVPPPRLKIPPPPVLGPNAELPVMVIPLTVIVPL